MPVRFRSGTRARIVHSFARASALFLAVCFVAPTAVADETIKIDRIEWVSGTRTSVPALMHCGIAHAALSLALGQRNTTRRLDSPEVRHPGNAGRGLEHVAHASAHRRHRLPERQMVADLPLDSEQRHIRWRRPYLINLPVSFMQTNNDVLIYTSYGVGVHGIGPIDIGPTADLQPRYGNQSFVSHTLRGIVAADRSAGDRLHSAVAAPTLRKICSGCWG